MRLVASVIAALLLLSSLALVAPAPARATNVLHHSPLLGVPDNQMVVAVIDTGADATHPEFGGWRGEANVTDPQIVAWYDFGEHAAPAPGVLWDALTAVPRDNNGHGTGTASLVGGKTLGANPGVKLAIAKITDASGSLVNIQEAIHWAADTVGADVISMSFGTIVPVAGTLVDADPLAVRDAWDAGALPVVAAGNGLGNAGVKYPAEGSSPASSPFAFSIGASGKTGTTTDRLVNGYFGNTDPEVIAWANNVRIARPGGGYVVESGTSFSTPLLAGWSSKVMQAAVDAGKPADNARVRQLLSWTANDDVALPYAIEGFGFVDDGRTSAFHTVEAAIAFATAGTLPPAPSPANVAANAASLALRAQAVNAGQTYLVEAPLPTSTPGHVGPAEIGVHEDDLYVVPLTAGDRLHVVVTYNDPTGSNDLDIFLYGPGAGADGLFAKDDLRASSSHGSVPGLNTEAFDLAPVAPSGSFTLVVEGFSVGSAGQSYSLAVTRDGVPLTATFLGDYEGAGSSGLL